MNQYKVFLKEEITFCQNLTAQNVQNYCHQEDLIINSNKVLDQLPVNLILLRHFQIKVVP